MDLQRILAILLALSVSLTPALAATYVIEHDDEVDQVEAMQERSASREAYYSEIERLRAEMEQLRSRYAQQESDRVADDYYDSIRRGYCDDDDLDDLDDLLDDLDDDDLDEDDEDDLRRLLRRCYGDYDYDYDFDRYHSRRYCDLDAWDYADNFHYSDYLYDVHRGCRRLHLQRDIFHDYFDDFEDRYDKHDTSYDPYDDVLHELDDRDFYKYGPGAYRQWGAWCESNRYRDGSLPDWCYERRRFITDIDWD